MATLTSGPALRRWIVRAAVSIVVAVILFRIVPFHAVATAIGRISPWTWAASLATFFAGHYLNAIKLRLLIGSPAPSVGAAVRAQYAGLVANLGLPGIAGGDLVRAAYLAPAAGTRRVALASVADRVIDTLTLLGLIAAALPIAGVPLAIGAVLLGARWWIAGAIAAALATGGALIALRSHPRVAAALAQVRTALAARRSAIAIAACISIGVQSAFVMTNVWLARQAGVETGPAAWFVAWPLSKLIAILPISLGGIGVREAALVSLLRPYGAPQEAVLASGILWQGVLATSGLIGLVATQVMGRATAAHAAGTTGDL